MWKWRIARNAIFYSTSVICTSPITRLVCPPKFFHNPCTLFPLGITVVPREIKDCLCKTRSIMQNMVYYGRCESSELFLLAFSLFNCLRKGQIWKEFIKVWQKCKQDDKRGRLIIAGFTKMTYFAKLENLAKDSLHVKVWQKI